MANTEQCLEFYYLRQSNKANLRVYSYLNEFQVSPVWSEPQIKNGIGGWQLAQVTLSHSLTSLPYKIMFEEYVQAETGGFITEVSYTL